MKTKTIIRLLTFSSWLPLVACATADDGSEKPVGGSDSINADDGADTNNASNGDNGNNSNNSNNANNANNEDNSNNANGDDDLLSGDEDFDKINGNAGANNLGVAANAGMNIAGFENNAPSGSDGGDKSANINAKAQNDNGLDAFKGGAADSLTDNAGAEISSANLAVANATAAMQPEAVPAPAAAVPAPAAVPAAQPAAAAPHRDVESTPSTLQWVGFKINEEMKKIELHIVTLGRPEFEIFEQTNRINQNELVFRFYNTLLRKKLKWDMDSSEFRSPVAFIRMREKKSEGAVDLIITHRDATEPLFYEKDGNFLLSYKIPNRYYAEEAANARQIKDKAISLSKNDRPLAKPAVTKAAVPVVGFPRFSANFSLTPQLEPISKFLSPNKNVPSMRDGLPATFDRGRIVGHGTGQILGRKTFMGVAQDSLEDDFKETAPEPSNGGNFSDAKANFDNKANANGDGSNLNDNDNAEPNAFSNLDDKADAKGKKGKTKPKAKTPAKPEAAAETFTDLNDKGNAAKTTELTGQAEDLEGADSSTASQKYSGKPIFMEFNDSPLSLVLKSFSEETGNNFVYPADIGALPVTIAFKGVPWDEALKGILETYSLGNVRIGQNVVRVDKIANLTAYMQAMEQATQFESRRVKTKVMIFRLNNGVSKDVKDRLEKLLANDITLDTRIKLSEDNRTNSIVMEAPENVLQKARAIIDRLDLETPQVEITSRIVEVSRTNNGSFGFAWGNNLNFDPGRALGFGSLNFPNSVSSAFSVDPAVRSTQSVGSATFKFGSINKFLDLDLLLRMEERKGTTNVLQSNRILVLDGQKASVLAGSSQFFRPASGGNVINPAPGAGGGANGLAEITFNLSLEVTPQVTALGNVIMNLVITSDTPGAASGETLASKSTRRLETQMIRASGDTGVIGGIYDTKKTKSQVGIPFLSDLPIIGALFRQTSETESQTELLIMVTPSIVSGPNGNKATDAAGASGNTAAIEVKPAAKAAKAEPTNPNAGRL